MRLRPVHLRSVDYTHCKKENAYNQLYVAVQKQKQALRHAINEVTTLIVEILKLSDKE